MLQPIVHKYDLKSNVSIKCKILPINSNLSLIK